MINFCVNIHICTDDHTNILIFIFLAVFFLSHVFIFALVSHGSCCDIHSPFQCVFAHHYTCLLCMYYMFMEFLIVSHLEWIYLRSNVSTSFSIFFGI